jgi:hypothetical protein
MKYRKIPTAYTHAPALRFALEQNALGRTKAEILVDLHQRFFPKFRLEDVVAAYSSKSPWKWSITNRLFPERGGYLFKPKTPAEIDAQVSEIHSIRERGLASVRRINADRKTKKAAAKAASIAMVEKHKDQQFMQAILAGTQEHWINKLVSSGTIPVRSLVKLQSAARKAKLKGPLDKLTEQVIRLTGQKFLTARGPWMNPPRAVQLALEALPTPRERSLVMLSYGFFGEEEAKLGNIRKRLGIPTELDAQHELREAIKKMAQSKFVQSLPRAKKQ